MPPVRVVADDDDATSRLLARRALEKRDVQGNVAGVAKSGDEALRMLESAEAPSLMILDWSMPNNEAFAICRKIRARDDELGRYTYLIMLTSRADSRETLGGPEAGVDDYIVKPFALAELEARLRVGRRTLALNAKLRAAHAECRRQAHEDALTGVLNRRGVLDGLYREIERGRRDQRCVTLMMFDVDGFKSINDTHGHPVGDEVLAESGHRLGRALRPYDVLGRLDGEEFLVVLTCHNLGEAAALGERLRAVISATPFATTAGDLPVSTCVGVATTETDGYSATTLLAAVDRALGAAKRSGRNRVVVQGVAAHA